jgi:hypothetical protein
MEMLKRAISRSDLAARVKVSPKVLSNVVCGSGRSPGIRRRIEEALGIPVWSTPEEFHARASTQRSERRTRKAI